MAFELQDLKELFIFFLENISKIVITSFTIWLFKSHIKLGIWGIIYVVFPYQKVLDKISLLLVEGLLPTLGSFLINPIQEIIEFILISFIVTIIMYLLNQKNK